jgi:hypothetical protein
MPRPINKLFKDIEMLPSPGEEKGGAGLNPTRKMSSEMAPVYGAEEQPVPRFADGGLVEPGAGQPPAGPGAATPPVNTGVTPGGAGLATPEGGAATPTGGANMEAEAKKLLRENPEVAAQMLKAAQDALEMGEMTEEMLIQGGKMAIVVSRNPDMYPKMKQRLDAMGAPDVPAEYDPEFVFTVMLLYLAWQQKDQLQATGSAGGDVGGTGDDGVQDFRDGGYVTHGSKAAGGGPVVGMGGPRDDMIRADLSNGEYVIPAHVVRDKGVDFFDKMLENYKPGKEV